MRKVASITWKDMLVVFRDWAALVFMIGGPLLLTVGMGLVTGAFSDDDTQTLPIIPVLIINQDEGEMGQALVELFQSEDLADLVRPEVGSDAAAAQELVRSGDYAAAVVIPAGFSAGMVPDQRTGELTATAAPIEVYADPARTISGGVIKSIVEEFVRRIQIGIMTIQVSLTELAVSGAVPTEQLPSIGQQMGAAMGERLGEDSVGLVSINRESLQPGTSADFNPLAYFAPAMALLFLMYTVTVGARSFLAERQQKTLARMLAAPVTPGQVLGGKVLGIFMSGVAQVGLLIALSAVLFGLNWGSPLGVVLLILAAAAAATGWGLVVASIASTPAQISTIGSTLMLSFGILGGSFVPLNQSSEILQALSKLTPNAWALDGFVALAAGGGLSDLLVPLAVLIGMAAVLFLVAAVVFGRRQSALLAG